jgi:hypothetical protein
MRRLAKWDQVWVAQHLWTVTDVTHGTLLSAVNNHLPVLFFVESGDVRH